MKELKPTQTLRVYDLLRQADFDVSDWENYRRPNSPSSNPKYCYNWAFESGGTIALCLWHREMRKDANGVHQSLNYRSLSWGKGQLAGVQRTRAEEMDRIIRRAWDERLPIRVLVVDRASEGSTSRRIRRLLDPAPWFVARYDDQGNCRLQRSTSDALSSSGEKRLARISFNSSGWRRPTGEARGQESGSFNAKNGFGHEDWLFRDEWVVDGWRYAFIQGIDKIRTEDRRRPIDLTLYTCQPDNRFRLVATIYGLEVLADSQARKAMSLFRSKGWLGSMRDEVRAIEGNVKAMGNFERPNHALNVRYRLENLDRYPENSFLPADDWIRSRRRYQPYKLSVPERVRLEFSRHFRRGRQDAPETRRLFRKGTKPVAYAPEHDEMQSKLMAALRDEYGAKHVWRERDFVDVRVETDQELIYFEIKTDLDPRAVLRQAIGQILEYAYHPARSGRTPDRLVIVGRTALGQQDSEYLRHLFEVFGIPISYREIAI